MKQMKKFAAVLLAIVMFAAICPLGALADTDRQRDETDAVTDAVAEVIAAISALSPVENLASDLEDLESASEAVSHARELYDLLTDEEKDTVSNYVILLEAEDVIVARCFEKLVVDRLGVLEEVTLANLQDVEDVHEAYGLLTSRQRSYVRETYTTILTDAINAINAEWEEVHAVEALITNLTQDIEEIMGNPEAAELIRAAEEAFNNLDEAQQAVVRNYSFLEGAIAALESAGEILDVTDLISLIPEIVMPEDQLVIEEARAAYEALSEEEKALVTNYDYLVESERVLEVVLAINEIPEVINSEDGENIRGIRAALSALEEDEIGYRVGNSAELDDAEIVLEVVEVIAEIPFVLMPGDEAAIDAADTAYYALAGELQDRVGNSIYLFESHEVMSVVTLIDEISELEPTIANKPYFVEVDGHYNELSEELRPRVGNYRQLAEILAIITNLEIEIADCKSLIAAIPFILLPEDVESVEAARSAYDALNEEQRTYVDNYDYLVESEAVMEVVNAIAEIPMPIMPEDAETIASAREGYDGLNGVARPERVGNADHLFYSEEALPVVLLIDEIPTEGILLADSEFILFVEEEYEALSDEAKEYVGNKQSLFDALDILDALWAQVNNALDLLNEVYSMRDRALYIEDNGVITEARDAFDGLNEDQQNYIITNYSHLIPALEEAERVVAVVIAITAIPKPLGAMDENGERHIEADRNAVDAANNAYLELSEAERARVSNAEILDAAYAAIDVVVMIDALELNPVMIAYTEQIEAARAAYEELSDLAKEYVGNIDELEFAENELARLWDEINNVINLIDGIPFPVRLSDAPYINMVRGAYDALTDEQKTYVTNYSTLLYAERELCTLYGQVAIVMTCITALPYQVTLDDADTIDAIWRAYNALTEEQQAEITNLPKLQNATEQIAQLQAQVDEVISLIAAIPELTEDNFDAFEAAVLAAREAYNAIENPVDAAYVTNYDELVAAEELLAFQLEQSALVQNVIDLIDAIFVGTDGNISAMNLFEIRPEYCAAVESYNSLSEELQSRVTNREQLLALQELYMSADAGIEIITRAVEYPIDTVGCIPAINTPEFSELYTDSEYIALVRAAQEFAYITANDLSEQQRSYIAAMLQDEIVILSEYDDVLYVYNDGHEDYGVYDYGWMTLVDYVYSLYAPIQQDVNGDGYINCTDAILLMRAAIGTFELNSLDDLLHDVNGDGVISIIDAMLIMRKALTL